VDRTTYDGTSLNGLLCTCALVPIPAGIPSTPRQAIVETIRYVGTQYNGVLDRRVPFGQWCLCFDENKKDHGLGQHDFQWHVTRFAQFRTRPKKFGHVNYRWNVRMGQSSNWPIVDLSYEHGAPFPGPCFSPIPAQHRASAASISLSSIH
jgi:hypothetical protein